jgi:hypothetical protein
VTFKIKSVFVYNAKEEINRKGKRREGKERKNKGNYKHIKKRAK